MKITEIEVSNFLAIGHTKLSLADLGLVHVSGINNDETSADSNGSGKSSLGDAIAWGFWGSTARGVGSDDVVNTITGKDCSVKITVCDNGDVYRVERYRKSAKHKNNLLLFKQDDQGAWIDLTKGTSVLTQRGIERLLGCSEDVFNAAVYSGQESLQDIPRMTDKQLKLLVEQAAGVDVLSGAYEIARKRALAASEKRSTAQIGYDRAIERHADATASVDNLTAQSERWNIDHTAKLANLKELTQEAVEAFKLSRDDVKPALEQSFKDKIVLIQDKIASVKGEQQRERTLLGDQSTAIGALQVLRGKLNGQNVAVDIAKKAIDTAKQGVKAARDGIGEPCDSCGRPLLEDHLEEAIKRAQARADKAVKDHSDQLDVWAATEARIAGFEKAVTQAKASLDNHRAAMVDVSAEGVELTNCQRDLQILQATQREVNRLKQGAIDLGERYKAEAQVNNPFGRLIDEADKEIVARASHAATCKAAAIEYTELENYAQAVVDVYAPAGVRAHRLDEATPYLNERTAHYLGSLADGAIDAFWTTLSAKRNGDLTEKFSVTVEKPGSAPNFNALSGGEKRKVRLACSLALQDLVATRATKSIELFIGDEIDDALDPAGLERLMGVLEEKAKQHGTVIIVSHNDLGAYARRSMVVEKTNGLSTVTIQ